MAHTNVMSTSLRKEPVYERGESYDHHEPYQERMNCLTIHVHTRVPCMYVKVCFI